MAIPSPARSVRLLAMNALQSRPRAQVGNHKAEWNYGLVVEVN